MLRSAFTMTMIIVACATFAGPAASASASAPGTGGASAVSAAARYPAIVLYSTSWCPHCTEARTYMREKGIPFTERDVEKDDAAMNDITTRYKSRGVPVIVIGNDQKVLKGFNPASFESAVKEVQQQK